MNHCPASKENQVKQQRYSDSRQSSCPGSYVEGISPKKLFIEVYFSMSWVQQPRRPEKWQENLELSPKVSSAPTGIFQSRIRQDDVWISVGLCGVLGTRALVPGIRIPISI